MNVNEIFPSIQGEGPALGEPVTFLRLYGCNLRCVWCDTKFSYDSPNESHALSTGDVLARLDLKRPTVITGGEPLLQQAEIEKLVRAWPAPFDIETNGTIVPSATLQKKLRHIVVSPKLAGSKVSIQARYHPNVLEALAPRAHFKFVITDPYDVNEARGIVDRFAIPKDHVWLMPEGITAEELAKKSWVAAESQALGYRFTPRLHVLLWGSRRGV